ncbi:MAG: TonB-dependent receptor [Steroidobacterales bacterium]
MHHRRSSALVLAWVSLLASTCRAGDEAVIAADAALNQIVVVATTPLPGISIDADKLPGVIQSILAADLRVDGTASLVRALDAHLASISIGDTLDDAFQPDILYRGFAASPVLGTAQGLAVYQNGVRINEAFGDTVNWDLLPEQAIARIDLVSSNPSYGLNALGGAIAVKMKNGFDFSGGESELYGGSFNQRAGGVQYGGNDGRLGFYVAAKILDQDGWRLFAHDSVHQFYTDLALHSGRVALDVSYSHADNGLNGQGAAPVQELAISRSLVFTDPQANTDRVDFVSLNGSYQASAAISWQAVMYLRNYAQDVANGNTTSFVACTPAREAGYLCQGDGTTALLDAAGVPVPDPARASHLALGEDDLESIYAQGTGGSLQFSDSQTLFARANLFTMGIAVDTAQVNFSSDTEPGLINAARWVVPSGPSVATPETSAFASAPVRLRSDSRYSGLYLTDTISVDEAVAVTASGRYNDARMDLSDQRGAALSGRNSFSHFNPALGATMRLRQGLTAYADYSVNNRAPTASEIECSDIHRPCLLPSSLAGDPPDLRQVVATTTELGLRGKHSIGGAAMSWNIGVFRTALDDDIYAIATSANSGFFRNIGATRREGIEAGLDVHAPRWSAYLQYSLVAATFQSAFTERSASNPAADASGNIAVRPGDRLPGIPQNRLKLGADYHWQHGWSAGADVIAVGSRYYSGDESNQDAPLPGYGVANLHVSFHPGADWEVFASVRNLLGARYATYGLYSNAALISTPGVTGQDNRFQSPAPPRAFYAGARLMF